MVSLCGLYLQIVIVFSISIEGAISLNIIMSFLFIFFGIFFILQPESLIKKLKEKWKTEADLAFQKVIMRFTGILITSVGVIFIIAELAIFIFNI